MSQYATFTRSSKFEEMASMGTQGSSFEDPHNMIHSSAGVTMAQLDYSAFDPIL
jgi:tyrosinase